MAGEWEQAIVGDVFELVNGFAFKTKDFIEVGVPVIKIKNVKAGFFKEHQFSYVSSDFLESKSEKVARHADLLISMSGNRHDGSSETWVGKVAFFRNKQTYLINQRVGALRLKNNSQFEARYMGYLLSEWKYQKLFISIATSSGGQANLSPKQILGSPLQYPPLAEQKAIAHILGTLDDKIELNRRMNETLEEMARTLFKSWFVDFDPVRAKLDGRQPAGMDAETAALFPAEFQDSELGKIPKGWEVKKLGEETVVDRGLSYKGKFLAEDGMPMHNLNSIFEGGEYKKKGIKFYSGDYRERHKIRVGDLVIANTEQGHNRLLIGFAALIPPFWGQEGIFSQHLYKLVARESSHLTSNYLCHFINYPRNQQIISGYANGTTVNMLPADALQKPTVLIPTKDLVNKFSDVDVQIRKKCLVNQEHSQSLASLRDTLLPKLLSGELRIKDAEKFVEDAL
jgi:type I restriction enzyme, S subunit